MVKLATEELQTHVEKITGAKLAIVTEPTGDVPVKVYVGKSPHTDRLGISDEGLDDGAFRMVSGENYLVLLGHDSDFTPREPWLRGGSPAARAQFYKEWDAITGAKWGIPFVGLSRSFNRPMGIWEQDERGSLNAVYEFLRSLGVRWYFPGELGEIVPKMRSIALPKVDEAVRPDFPVRRMMQYYRDFFRTSREEILWQLRLGLTGAHEGTPDGLLGLGAPGHGISRVIGREGVKEAHPEYFAIWGGKRVDAPCLSSQGLLQETVRYARAIYETYGEPRVDISPTDGYGSLCQCDLCKGKATPERGWNGQLSDYVWGYVDGVAKELYKTHPDRRVGCLAYSTYQLPPEKIARMSPNVSIIICRWRSNFTDSEPREQFQKLTNAWLDKLPSKELYIWDYYLHSRPNGSWEGVPVYFPHIISDDLRFLKGKSKGEFIEVARNHPGWNLKWHALASNHLNVYVTARLYWDADQDIHALLEEYYDKFYGPARKEMKAFIEYAEANYMKATKDATVIDRLFKLRAAAQKAAGDTVYGERIDLLVPYMKPLNQRREQIAKGREGVPKVRAYPRDKADITLDGKMDEKFWDGTAVYGLSELQTGREPGVKTSFRVAWAGDNLYFGIHCQDTDTKSLNISATKDGDTNIWLGDNIELLLETQTHSYYQIAISPTGAIVDLDRKRGLVTRWSANAEVATHVGDGYWSLEVRVPVAGEGQEVLDPFNGISGRRPTQTHPWFFNVCRQRVRDKEMARSAFSPTGKPTFHEVMKFGELYVR